MSTQVQPKHPFSLLSDDEMAQVSGGKSGWATTQAVGEEGGVCPTTLRTGEEGGVITTLAIGEEGGATTLAIGEEGGATTLAIGEEGGGLD